MPNQYLPLPPLEELRPLITNFYMLGLTDKAIASCVIDHFDKTKYQIGVKSVYRLRGQWNLHKARKQDHTDEEIIASITELRKLYPRRGAETIRHQLRIEGNLRIPRERILKLLNTIEPEAVQQRKGKRFKRKVYYSPGVNAVWTQDQHDKWGARFGLWLHNGIDPFSGCNLWIKVWWTNSNPRLIVKFYLEAARYIKGVPILTQSDPGTENFGVANVHTLIRHSLDQSLSDTLQHVFKRKHHNVKSEANWSVFRSDFAPGYEDHFQHGVDQGWYDVNDPLENLVFRWVAIPWLQVKLNEWLYLRNTTSRRANKHKALPHGIPVMIRDKPENYGTKDFKVEVDSALFDQMEAQYAPPNHEVFLLTPLAFDRRAKQHFEAMGRPAISHDTFWDIYRDLLHRFLLDNNDNSFNLPEILQEVERTQRQSEEEEKTVVLLPGLKKMREGQAQMNLTAGTSQAPAHTQHIALQAYDITSDEETEEEDEDQGHTVQ